LESEGKGGGSGYRRSYNKVRWIKNFIVGDGRAAGVTHCVFYYILEAAELLLAVGVHVLAGEGPGVQRPQEGGCGRKCLSGIEDREARGLGGCSGAEIE